MLEHVKKIILPTTVTTSEVIKNLNLSGLQIVLIVDENNKLIATVTDGDIRKGFANGLRLDDKIISVANLKPKTVNKDVPKKELRNLFNNYGYKAIPIIDNKNLLIGCHLISNFLQLEKVNVPFLIMAGGLGTRLGRLTKNCPKPMLKIKGKPILQHIIEKASKDGFFNIFISTYFLSHMIEDYFGTGENFNVKITYLKETTPLGTAGCLQLLPKLNTPIVVTNGDLISKIGYKTILDFHQSVSANATMAVIEHKIQHPFGVIKSDGVDLIEFDEKPIWKTNVNAGIYVLDNSAITLVKPRENTTMPEIFKRYKSKKKKTVIFPLHENWIDIGTPKNLQTIKNKSIID